MENEKCCFDCVSCIPTNSPLEVGLQHMCINPKGERYLDISIQWSKPCGQFRGYEDGK